MNEDAQEEQNTLSHRELTEKIKPRILELHDGKLPTSAQKIQFVKEINSYVVHVRGLKLGKSVKPIKPQIFGYILGSATRQPSLDHLSYIDDYLNYVDGLDPLPEFCKKFNESISPDSMLPEGDYIVRRYAYSEKSSMSVSTMRIISSKTSGNLCRLTYTEHKTLYEEDDTKSTIKVETHGVIVTNYTCHMFIGRTTHSPHRENRSIDEEYAGIDVKYISKPTKRVQTEFYGLTLLTEEGDGSPIGTRVTLTKLPSDGELGFQGFKTGLVLAGDLTEEDREAIVNEITDDTPYLKPRK